MIVHCRLATGELVEYEIGEGPLLIVIRYQGRRFWLESLTPTPVYVEETSEGIRP